MLMNSNRDKSPNNCPREKYNVNVVMQLAESRYDLDCFQKLLGLCNEELKHDSDVIKKCNMPLKFKVPYSLE